jgi:hypothetical protein
MVPDYQSQAT